MHWLAFRIISTFVFLSCFVFSTSSEAHRLKYPKSLTLELRNKKVLLTMTYTVNPGQEASMLRALYDRDADGRLNGEEQERLTEYLEKMATMFLRVSIDGEIARLVQLDSSMQRADFRATSSKAMGMQLRFSAPLPEVEKGKTFTMSVVDRDKDAKKHVPTVVDVGKNWSVIMADQGEFHPTTRQVLNVKLSEEATLNLEIRRGPKPAKQKEEG